MKKARQLTRALLKGESYFGPELRALQGPPERHSYFLPIAKHLCDRIEGPLKLVEVGSWAGASTITWARAFAQLGRKITIVCVDIWEPYFDLAIEASPHYRMMNAATEDGLVYELFRHNIEMEGIAEQVEIRRGYSRDVLPTMAKGDYHLAYIDGSHLYDDAKTDIQEAKRLVCDGGIICGDDLEVQFDAVSAGELASALSSGRDFITLQSGLAFHPGVTAAVGEELGHVSTWQGLWAAQKDSDKIASVELDLSNLKMPNHISRAAYAPTDFKFLVEKNGYRIFESRDGFIALASNLSPGETLEFSDFHTDMPPALFIAPDLASLHAKLDQPNLNVAPQSTDDDSKLPRVIGEYLNFNLIAYDHGIIGIDRVSGPLDVTKGIDHLLESLPEGTVVVGDDVDAVKVGIIERNRIQKIADRITKLEFHFQKQKPAVAELLGSYGGFNVVRHGEDVVAVDRSIGDVNVEADCSNLQRTYGTDRVFPAKDWAAATHLIDNVQGHRKQAAQMAELNEVVAELSRSMAGSQANVADIAKQLEEGLARLSHLEEKTETLQNQGAALAQKADSVLQKTEALDRFIQPFRRNRLIKRIWPSNE